MKRREFLRLGAVAAAGGYALAQGGRSATASGLFDLGGVTLVRGSTRIGGYTVPPGQTLRFDPTRDVTLELRGNLVVRGTLELKPDPGVTHTLRFVGIREADFVGGGMGVMDSDVGLWVVGSGRLDIRGTPRSGWNRTGVDSSGSGLGWRRTDEILTTPFEPGDYSTFAPYRGTLTRVTSPNGRVFTQEAFNLTRNVRIEGTPRGRTHILIMSTAPQSIRYAAIRYVGPRQGALPDRNHFVLGRYGLHFHMNGDGSRGSVVTGVVVRDCGSHAFVPHMSDGITFTDCIAFDVNEDAYWWNPGDATNDTTWDHCMAAMMVPIPSFRGYRLAGFNLGVGTGNALTDSVAVGNLGNVSASGFTWPESGSGVWLFRGCVAHNNKADGIFIWQNRSAYNVIQGFVAFRNDHGIEHGAYANLYQFDGTLTFSNGNGVELHASSSGGPPGPQLSYGDCRIYDGITIVKHAVQEDGVGVFAGPVVSEVVVDEGGGQPANYDFIDCTTDGSANLEASDFQVRFMQPSSVYRVQRPNGTAYRLNPDGTATAIPAFA